MFVKFLFKQCDNDTGRYPLILNNFIGSLVAPTRKNFRIYFIIFIKKEDHKTVGGRIHDLSVE